MKNTLTRTLTVLALILTLSVGLSAQLTKAALFILNTTTLNGALTATQTTLVLTSASASTGASFGAPAAGQCLVVDNELMRIVSMNSTTATVTRGLQNPAAHATSSNVFTGPCANFFTYDPPAGACTPASFPVPWINTTNGTRYWCRSSRVIGANVMGQAPDSDSKSTNGNP